MKSLRGIVGRGRVRSSSAGRTPSGSPDAWQNMRTIRDLFLEQLKGALVTDEHPGISLKDLLTFWRVEGDLVEDYIPEDGGLGDAEVGDRVMINAIVLKSDNDRTLVQFNGSLPQIRIPNDLQCHIYRRRTVDGNAPSCRPPKE